MLYHYFLTFGALYIPYYRVTEIVPTEYRGYQIFDSNNQFDVVSPDNVNIHMNSSLDGAKAHIDEIIEHPESWVAQQAQRCVEKAHSMGWNNPDKWSVPFNAYLRAHGVPHNGDPADLPDNIVPIKDWLLQEKTDYCEKYDKDITDDWSIHDAGKFLTEKYPV